MIKNCAVCGVPFEVSPGSFDREHHCSYACRHNLEARFWSKVDKSGECWLWTAGKRNGYGNFWIGTKQNGRDQFAHRVAYELTYGPIPDGLDILHSCDNPACVRPDHLRPGTHLDNMRDMASRERRKPVSGEQNGMARLTKEKVTAIRQRYRPGVVTYKQLADEYGVTPSNIMHIVKGNIWKD